MAEAADSTTASATARGDCSMRVLLVDDQAMIGEAVRRLLSGHSDLEFHYCGQSADALAAAVRIRPTVILQDLVMPGTDGLTLLRGYRAEPLTADIPVVVLSTKEEPAVKSEAFALGASDYLIKLPDPIELVARIRRHSMAYINQLQRDVAYREKAAAQEQVLRLSLQQQQMEEMVAQRLESVGQLAAGVAHEINTPVQYINDNMHFIRESVQELIGMVDQLRAQQQPVATESEDLKFLREKLPSALSGSMDGLARVTRIVSSMKEFSQADQKEMSPVDLNKAIENTLLVARNDYLAVAEVETKFGVLPPLTCYGAEVNQALLNIVVNAAEAVGVVFATKGCKGRIVVTTRCDGSDVLISIADTGNGIPEAVRPKIFDPFFTTKEVGAGTGQGLSIARNIVVRRHGGALTFQTDLGRGTTFLIRLPTERARPTAAQR